MYRAHIRLTEEQSRKLRRLAAERRTSVAELIRQAVEGLLRERPDIDRVERKKRALAAAGRFRSGGKDLATTHNDYLAEAFGE